MVQSLHHIVLYFGQSILLPWPNVHGNTNLPLCPSINRVVSCAINTGSRTKLQPMARLVRILRDKAPVVVFSSLCAGACYAVYYAHYQQIAEKKVMRQGVINDIRRDRIKQRERQHQEQQ